MRAWRDGAEQVAEDPAALGVQLQVDRARVDARTEQIQVQLLQVEREDVAAPALAAAAETGSVTGAESFLTWTADFSVPVITPHALSELPCA